MTQFEMVLHDSAAGMNFYEALRLFDVDAEFMMYESTREGEAISLASSSVNGGRDYFAAYSPTQLPPAIYFIVWDVDTESVVEFWAFPRGYKGVHPAPFLWAEYEAGEGADMEE